MRTSSGWKTRPCTSSTGRTSDDCETSKWIWASGRRTIGSEMGERDALEMAAGFPAHRGARNSVLAVDLDCDGSAARNPPVRRGILALVLMAMLLVRPLLFTVLI